MRRNLILLSLAAYHHAKKFSERREIWTVTARLYMDPRLLCLVESGSGPEKTTFAATSGPAKYVGILLEMSTTIF